MSKTSSKRKSTTSNKKKTKQQELVSLDALLLKVNTDEAYRARFLAKPVEELKKHGMVLDDASARRVRDAARELRRKLPEIAKLPSGATEALRGAPPGEHQFLCI